MHTGCPRYTGVSDAPVDSDWLVKRTGSGVQPFSSSSRLWKVLFDREESACSLMQIADGSLHTHEAI